MRVRLTCSHCMPIIAKEEEEERRRSSSAGGVGRQWGRGGRCTSLKTVPSCAQHASEVEREREEAGGDEAVVSDIKFFKRGA